MGKSDNNELFQGLLRNAANIRKRRFRQRKSRAGLRPNTRATLIDQEWRKRFEPILKQGKQPRVRLIDAVKRYCTIYLKHTQSTLRYRHARNIFFSIADFIGPEILIHELREAHLSKYQDHLLESGYKITTVNRYMGFLNSLLTFCCTNWRIVDDVPLIPNIKSPIRPYRYLNEEEESRLLSKCGEHMKRLLVFILGTGARKSEAVNLKWPDVFIDGKSRGWVRFAKTKNGRAHSVPLPSHVEEMLRLMRNERPEGFEYVFWHIPARDVRNSEGGLKVKRGVPIPMLWPHREFYAAREEAGLRDVRIHDLRHTYASRLVMKGVSLLLINKLLNHADLEQTARYAHFSQDQYLDSVSVLDHQPDERPEEKVTYGLPTMIGVL